MSDSVSLTSFTSVNRQNGSVKGMCGILRHVHQIENRRQQINQPELGRRFDERLFEWVPYLYPDLDEGTSEVVESAAIEAGTINATRFLYVGAAR